MSLSNDRRVCGDALPPQGDSVRVPQSQRRCRREPRPSPGRPGPCDRSRTGHAPAHRIGAVFGHVTAQLTLRAGVTSSTCFRANSVSLLPDAQARAAYLRPSDRLPRAAGDRTMPPRLKPTADAGSRRQLLAQSPAATHASAHHSTAVAHRRPCHRHIAEPQDRCGQGTGQAPQDQRNRPHATISAHPASSSTRLLRRPSGRPCSNPHRPESATPGPVRPCAGWRFREQLIELLAEVL